MMEDKAPNLETDGSKQRLRFWLQMLRSTKYLENSLREKLRREYGTTLPRFDVLAILYKSRDGLKMSALSDGLMVSNGNVTGIVDRMVSDGMIEREDIPGDRRAKLVRLTEKGVTEFEIMAEQHEGWVAELLADINEQDIATAHTVLAKIRGE